jgi:hypothetical protein
VLAGAAGFLAFVFLLKSIPAMFRPMGFLRDDFLFPLWALWETARSPAWFVVATLAIAAAGGLWASRRFERLSKGRFLTVVGIGAVVLWSGLALTNRGFPGGIKYPFERDADYYADVAVFSSLAEIGSTYNERQAELSLHGRTHPPGAVALLFVLDRILFGKLTLVAASVVPLSALALWLIHAWARLHLVPGTSRAASLLWVTTPAVALYGETCMDMVFAIPLLAAGFLFSEGAIRARDRAPLVVGAILGRGALFGSAIAMGALFTFSTGVLVLAVGLYAASRIRARDEIRTLGLLLTISLATFVLILAGVRAVTGFDWLACLRTALRIDSVDASAFLSARYWALTRLMGVMDYLVLAGVGTSPLWIGALARGRSAFPPGPLPDQEVRDGVLVSLARCAAAAALVVLALGAYKIGETGRILLFLLPVTLLPVCRRLQDDPPDKLPTTIGLLALLGSAQALIFEAWLDTRW